MFTPATLGRMPDNVRNTLEKHYVGKWKGEVTYEGEKLQLAFHARWSAGDSAISVESDISDSKGNKNRYVGLVGWDAAQRSIVHTGFGDDGGRFVIRWNHFEPAGWQGTISGVYVGKSYDSAPAKVVFGKDTMEYEDLTLGKPWKEISRRQP